MATTPTPPNPDDDVRIAREALAQGDLHHALHHVAWALNANPRHADALAILNQIAAISPGDPADALPPLTGGAISAGEAALHAEFAARRGQYDLAFTIMAQVIDAMPDMAYIVWMTEWVLNLTASGAPVQPESIGVFLTRVGMKHREEPISDADERDRIAAFSRAIDGYVAARADSIPPMLRMMHSMVLRKVGRLEDALTAAQAAYDAEPTNPFTSVILGNAYRNLKQVDDALKAYLEALRLDPNYVDVYNDIGDLLVNAGRTEEAAAYYGKVLDKQPDHPYSAPAYYYWQYRLDGDPYWRDKLTDFARRHADNVRAAELLRDLAPTGVIYDDFLPEPAEATINVFKQIIAENPTLLDGTENVDNRFQIAVTALEAPSIHLALESIAPGLNGGITYTNIQQPDPRKPRSITGLTLWKYDGTNPKPALPPPSQTVSAEIARIASTPYTLDGWADAGKAVGMTLGDAGVDDLVRVMVHPPKRDSAFTGWTWVFRVQVAAALTIAGTSADWDRPAQKKGLFGKSTEEAPRKKTLWALLFGQMDWTISAAIIALYAIARREPDYEREIAKWFGDAFFQPHPRPGYVPYLHALASCALRLKSTNTAYRAPMRKAIEED